MSLLGSPTLSIWRICMDSHPSHPDAARGPLLGPLPGCGLGIYHAGFPSERGRPRLVSISPGRLSHQQYARRRL